MFLRFQELKAHHDVLYLEATVSFRPQPGPQYYLFCKWIKGSHILDSLLYLSNFNQNVISWNKITSKELSFLGKTISFCVIVTNIPYLSDLINDNFARL